jgi:hypothetical protein
MQPINDVSVNRGNCHPKFLAPLPISLKFGQIAWAVFPLADPCNVIEAVVETDLGSPGSPQILRQSWTFTWN